MGPPTIVSLSDSQRGRPVPPARWTPSCEEATTRFVSQSVATETIFRDHPLVLHTRVIGALWGIDEGAAEAHRRLRPFDGQVRSLTRATTAVMAARSALAIRDLVDDEGWGEAVWPLLSRVAGYGSLAGAEWKQLDQATSHLDTRDHAHYAVRGAARRWLSTSSGAAQALCRLPDMTRYIDLLVELAELTSY